MRSGPRLPGVPMTMASARCTFAHSTIACAGIVATTRLLHGRPAHPWRVARRMFIITSMQLYPSCARKRGSEPRSPANSAFSVPGSRVLENVADQQLAAVSTGDGDRKHDDADRRSQSPRSPPGGVAGPLSFQKPTFVIKLLLRFTIGSRPRFGPRSASV
jgi:hypothetical protein